MITLKRLGIDGMFVEERHIPKLKTKNPALFRVFHDQIGEIGIAKCTMIQVEDMDYTEFLADIETGTCYHPDTLRCMSGPLELRK